MSSGLVLYVGELELALHRAPLVGGGVAPPAIVLGRRRTTKYGVEQAGPAEGVGSVVRSRAELAAVVAALQAMGSLLPDEPRM